MRADVSPSPVEVARTAPRRSGGSGGPQAPQVRGREAPSASWTPKGPRARENEGFVLEVEAVAEQVALGHLGPSCLDPYIEDDPELVARVARAVGVVLGGYASEVDDLPEATLAAARARA